MISIVVLMVVGGLVVLMAVGGIARRQHALFFGFIIFILAYSAGVVPFHITLIDQLFMLDSTTNSASGTSTTIAVDNNQLASKTETSQGYTATHSRDITGNESGQMVYVFLFIMLLIAIGVVLWLRMQRQKRERVTEAINQYQKDKGRKSK